jgi:hypothetical protein
MYKRISLWEMEEQKKLREQLKEYSHVKWDSNYFAYQMVNLIKQKKFEIQ